MKAQRHLGSTDAPTDESLGELISRLSSETGALVQAHVALARTEIEAQAKHAIAGGAVLIGAAVIGLLALGVLSSAAAWALAEAMEPWTAFLLVGGFWALVAVVAAVLGMRRLRRARENDLPNTIREDKAWLNEMS